ncbi:PREDICTED: nyctalopin-like [Branchiostoma belcheri]|uniref:Nyctalopin-like n=1 Tax=Branchiostoma belcheri TaxID=7741 RepID=A0A6P4Y095_BRABE|nr:PREDICTED: nyctalopin-like [Branchiostoma belcheri]
MRNISVGTFANIPQLTILFLFSNQITKIQTGAFKNLRLLGTLNLDSNRITAIEAGAFSNLPQLEILSLSSNKITRIQAGALSNLPQLRSLKLQSNKMFAISPLAYGLSPSIPEIKLDKNPWHCDCRMAPFKLKTTKFPSFKDLIICAKPSKFRGKKLADVNYEELICKEPTVSPPTPIQTTSALSTSSKDLVEAAFWPPTETTSAERRR